MTTETKVTHTPGPWMIGERDSSDPQRAEIGIIASYSTEYGHSSRTVATAFGETNAHLIAAAPDMLEALENIESETLDEYAEDRSLEDLHKQLTRILFIAQAAIAKAKGGAA